jgi:uncharacterized membrane protein YoaK (UPF0700 family)
MLAGATLGATFGLVHGRDAILLPAAFAAILASVSAVIPRAWRRLYQVPVARTARPPLSG